MINPRSPFPTRLLLFLRPWSLEILEPATKPYLLSPRYNGVLIVMAGPLFYNSHLLSFLPSLWLEQWCYCSSFLCLSIVKPI